MTTISSGSLLPSSRSSRYHELPTTEFDSDKSSLVTRSNRRRLSKKTLILIMLSICTIGLITLYTRSDSTLAELKKDLTDKFKQHGFGYDDHTTTPKEEEGEVDESRLIEDKNPPSFESGDEDNRMMKKKMLFSKSKVQEVQTKLENGFIGGYVWHAELQDWSGDLTQGEGRLIIVGDVHGTHESLLTLLARLSFTPSVDKLLHVGDLVSKAPLVDSLAAAKLLRKLGAQGVRGNHDQGVIEWRRWMEAYGNTKLNEIGDEAEGEGEVEIEKKKKKKKKKQKVNKVGALLGYGWEWLDLDESDLDPSIVYPEDFIWGSPWFEIARNLPKEDYDYLESLPLTLHLQDFNTYLVHAGMLPGDFSSFTTATTSSTIKPSPLPALISSLSAKTFKPSSSDSLLLHSTFERSLLLVNENIEPFTLLDVRALTGNGTQDDPWLVTKLKKGVPWSEVWNDAMEICEEEEGCQPVNLLYGHWAGRGLELRKNSFGLDSGCVYGRKLSALVVSTTDALSSPLSKPQTQSTESFRTSILGTSPSTSSSTPEVDAVEEAVVPVEKVEEERVELKASWQSGGQGQGGGQKYSSFSKDESLKEEEEDESLGGSSFWKPDGKSSIENLEEGREGVAIAEKKRGLEGRRGEKRAKKVKVLDNDAFDDIPVELNGRKTWVISLECPDLEAM